VLGNLDAQRDWSDARDFVRGFWLQLQQPEPRDFIFASGALRSVREFVEMAFSAVGLSPDGLVRSSPEFYRPSETVPLQGDSSLTRSVLGWKPEFSLEKTVSDMVLSELAKCKGFEVS
jgi:GDPmannose 4,6-dehydratase